jgi:hypothetical protein
MTSPHWVLDTGALLAYAHGVNAVGQILVDVADTEGTVAVPLVCVLEAYSLLRHEEYELLRMLRGNPAVQTISPGIDLADLDDCPGIGGMARLAGRLGAGHAAFVALVNAAGVVTSRRDQIATVLGDLWPMIEV